ncbi:MAG: Rieske 2Fe-2S domain-containing protein [Chloroflexi bacterium]|nr:Rieske 2Fe-2S domain-containing protein [Chloroflexota bacterium]
MCTSAPSLGGQGDVINPLWTVHNSAYSATAFALERERILRRVWTFVCHSSELPEVGSFLTRQVAGDPIVLVRTGAETIRAFHNVCRHRGSLVVSEPSGTGKGFRCPYHHWAYSMEGELLALPGEDAYAGSGFVKSQTGLVPLRVDLACGLVFVCLDPDAPPLHDYLGSDLLAVLEAPLGEASYEIFHYDSWLLKANWKLFAENGRDGYHVPFVHHTFLGKASPPQPYRLFPTGHAVQHVTWAHDAVDEETWRQTTRFPLPGFQPGDGWIVNIFPDVVVMARTSVVEILSQVPLTHEETLYEVRVLGLKGDSEEARVCRRLAFQTWLQTQQPEDKQAMENQQWGLVSQSVRTSIIARGVDATTGIRGDDNRLRQFWQVWRSMLGTDRNAVPEGGSQSATWPGESRL